MYNLCAIEEKVAATLEILLDIRLADNPMRVATTKTARKSANLSVDVMRLECQVGSRHA